jgi:hypothetical protein
MPSPFPGMDPYMEYPALWPGFHHNIINDIQLALIPLVRPNYVVLVEQRQYEDRLDRTEGVTIGDVDVVDARRHQIGTNGSGRSPSLHVPTANPASDTRARVIAVQIPPVVEVREHYLEIRERASRDLVTTIEVLSPANKRPGVGRDLYERKRQETVATLTSLVEIDLLRAGGPLPLLTNRLDPLPRAELGDYRVLVSRGHRRHAGELYPIDLHDPLPRIPIPLRPDDAEPMVDLQTIITNVYDQRALDLLLDYRDEPVPPLTPAQAEWADQLLRSKGLR